MESTNCPWCGETLAPGREVGVDLSITNWDIMLENHVLECDEWLAEQALSDVDHANYLQSLED